MEKLTQIALPQATDAQLSGLGWTAGQIKEVRKYLKVAGYQRNAHQRALCRRYSDAQRALFAVAAKPAKTRKGCATGTEWTLDEIQLLVSLYLKHVKVNRGVRNRIVIREEFAAVFPERTSINITLSTIAGLDKLNPAKGYGPEAGSALLREVLREVDAARFSA